MRRCESAAGNDTSLEHGQSCSHESSIVSEHARGNIVELHCIIVEMSTMEDRWLASIDRLCCEVTVDSLELG